MGKKPKRTVKDSVFVTLFKSMGNALELYRSFHPEDSAVTEEDCELLTLKTILVDGIYNDFGMLVRDRLIILMEAQSTFSRNLAVRILLYYAETVSRYVENHEMNLYSAKEIRIPRPELYMVYAGPRKNVPDTLRLSDLYGDPAGGAEYVREHGGLDLEVKVIRRTGRGDILDQYVRFCEISDAARKEHGNTLNAARATIGKCLGEGVLVEFLSSRREEVQEAMVDLYNEEVISKNYEREIWQEARQKGELSGIEKGIQAMVEVLKDVSQSRENAAETIAEKFGLQPQTAAEKVARYW